MPNVYDVDGTDELVPADLRVGGDVRKMIQANKNGFRVRTRPHELQADCGEPLRHGELGVARRLATGRPR